MIEIREMPSEIELYRIITTKMQDFGVPAGLVGYHYIREAVKQVVELNSPIPPRMGDLYDMTAKAFNKSSVSVERSIRHAVEWVFDRSAIEDLRETFGAAIDVTKGKAVNSEFIRKLVDSVRLDIAQREEWRKGIQK